MKKVLLVLVFLGLGFAAFADDWEARNLAPNHPQGPTVMGEIPGADAPDDWEARV